MSEKYIDQLIKLVTSRRISTLLLCLLLVGFTASYARFLQPSLTYQDMLSPEFPPLVAYENIQNEYTRDDNIQVVIAPAEGDVFTRETITLIHSLTEKLWKTPFSTRVDSLTNFQNTTADGDDLIVAPLAENPLSLTVDKLANIRSIALSDPTLHRRLVSETGHVTAINVSLAFPNVNMNEKLDATAFVRDLVRAETAGYTAITTHIAGSVPFDETAMLVGQQDTGMFLMATFVIVLVFLGILLRNISTLIPSLFVILFSVTCGMAFAGFMGWKLTPMSSPIPLMILILAVADCVHIITSFLQNMRQGMVKVSAMQESLRINFGPIAATSITTAVGFLTMNFSSSDSLGHMGSQVAFGVMVAFFLSVTLLPASICLLPVKIGNIRPVDASFSNAWYQQLVRFIDRSRTSILGVSLLLVAFLGYGASQNILNDKFYTYFSEETPFRQAIEFTDKHMGGTYNVSYNLHAMGPNKVSTPAFLQKIDSFANWLRTQEEVIQVYNIADTFKRLNKDMHGGEATSYTLPESAELAAQYLLLYELSLPYGLDLNDQINFDKSATRVQVTLKSLSTMEMLAFEKRAAYWLTTNLPNTKTEGSSVQIMFSHMARLDVEGMFKGTFTALLLISGLLVFVFGSLRIGLISLIPNLLPTIAAFGIWGLFVGEVGLGLAMVSGLTMGVVVDDTIHFLSKYQRARTKKGLAVPAALEYAFAKAGVSILITSLVLFAGFIVMIFAQFRLNADLGLMTSIIIVLALVFDFILLPVLLLLFDKREVEPVSDHLTA